MARVESGETRKRLMDAATELFAERGFHGTTARDIAERAGVNLAAANYHFGSKRDLYLEVLRGEFAGIKAALSRQHADVPPTEALARLPRRKIEAILAARIRAMCGIIIGPPAGTHARLMQREMTDPSSALPVIVEEFVQPMRLELQTLIATLAPSLDAGAVERCANSVIGQIIFYRFCRPALLQMLGRDEYPKGFGPEVAAHVMAFTTGGIERRAREKKGKTCAH